MSGFTGFVAAIGRFIESAMSTQWVVLILVPILVTAGAIALKQASRKVRQAEPADSLFGFDLGVTACLTLLVSGFVFLRSDAPQAERQYYVEGLFVVLMLFVLALTMAALFMHKSGWDGSNPPKPTQGAWWGVNAIGLILLVIAFVLTGGTFR